jgi:putative transposase
LTTLTIPDRYSLDDTGSEEYKLIMLRKDSLVTGNIYHIFNRGVNKGDIFFLEKDYCRFLLTAKHYKTKGGKFSYERSNSNNDTGSLDLEFDPRIEILAFSLMPNHFHFLIRQLQDDGITWFMQHLTNSYVHYLNLKHKRVGPLFQGRFKNVLIESDEQLLHVSRYIHLNPLISGLVSDLKNYSWSSYSSYIGSEEDGLSNPELVLKNFKTKEAYKQFVLNQADYAKSLEQIKHIALDY